MTNTRSGNAFVIIIFVRKGLCLDVIVLFYTLQIILFLSGESAPSSSKEPPAGASGKDKGIDILQKQETMFSSMERQYEMARIATHTHKGFGLGFTSQSFIPK